MVEPVCGKFLRVPVFESTNPYEMNLTLFLVWDREQSERAARKATILQMATMYTVLGGTLLNLGVTVGSQGSQVLANGSYVGAGGLFLAPKTDSQIFLPLTCGHFSLLSSTSLWLT